MNTELRAALTTITGLQAENTELRAKIARAREHFKEIGFPADSKYMPIFKAINDALKELSDTQQAPMR